MGELRSRTPLSENDYECIAAAVMETARGRWFMDEFARRNRRSDTLLVLNALGRLEQAIGLEEPRNAAEAGLREAEQLISDLRLDLERLGGTVQDPASGLAARLEAVSAGVAGACERLQDTAWKLREAGVPADLCGLLDGDTREIFSAAEAIGAAARQIDKVADTVAMLESNVKAISAKPDIEYLDAVEEKRVTERADSSRYETTPRSQTDEQLIEIDAGAGWPAAERLLLPLPGDGPLLIATELLDTDDVGFAEDVGFADAAEAPRSPVSQPPSAPLARAQADLRAIDALPPQEKLAYFA